MSSQALLEEQIKEANRSRPRLIGESVYFPSFVEATPLEKVEQVVTMPETIELSDINRVLAVRLVGWQYQPATDPFSLTLNEFLGLGLSEAQEMHGKAFELCKDLLEKAWKRGIKQVVICDRKILYETTSSEDIPNELVEQLAKQYNKACYVFSAPDMVEDCVWTVIDEHDYYPTISLYVGTEESIDSEVVKTAPIQADFDTGNPYYRVFDASKFSDPITSFTALQMRQGTHLGMNYTYFQKKVKICAKDESGAIHSLVRNIRLVRDWLGSALLQASPNRVAYIGRDLARDLGIKIELDPSKRITRITNI